MQTEINQELVRIVSETVGLTLGMAVASSDSALRITKPAPVGTVHIVGGWNGAVSVAVDSELGAQFADVIFGSTDVDKETLTLEVVRELTNIIGGNVKSLLGAQCALSSPKTIFADPQSVLPPESTVVTALHFGCNGGQIEVTLSKSLIDLGMLLSSYGEQSALDSEGSSGAAHEPKSDC